MKHAMLCASMVLAALLLLLAPVAGQAPPPNAPMGMSGGIQPISVNSWDAQLPPDSKWIDGFTLQMHAENTLLVGYHAVRLTARSTSTFSADRTIEIIFQPEDASLAGANLGGANLGGGVEGRIRSVIVCSLQLTQGVPAVSKDVYLPHYTYGAVYNVRVTENGRALPGYELTIGSPRRANSFVAIPNRIGVLLPREVVSGQQSEPWQRTPDPTALLSALRPTFGLQPAVPGSSSLAGAVPLSFAGWDIHHQTLLAAFPTVSCVLTEDQLWDDWLGYEPMDILVLPLPMLQRLAISDPAKATAIRHFAAAGGTLWLYAADSEQAVHKVFATKSASAAVKAESQQRLNRDLRSAGFTQLPDGVWIQDYAAGRLVCISEAYPFPGSQRDWASLLEINPPASITAVRRGVDPAFGDSRFWHWVLPNVAKPPVYPFLTLLGLFAFCVGPVAYRISSQLKRVYLMLLAAPVLAVATTVLMIGYGLVSDGLGYQARVREITWVDSSSGTGLRWARATYFAGIRPPDGLQFNAHTAVYPYPQERIERVQMTNEDPAAGRIVLDDGVQQFAFGFLPSRQQRQFITFAPQDNLGGVSADPLDGELFAQQRTVHNHFPFPLRSLFMRDERGAYWFVEQVDAEQTAEAIRYADTVAAKELRLLYADHVLEYPPGFQRRGRWTGGNGQRFDLVSNAAVELPQAYRGLQEGLAEFHLRTMLQIDGELPSGHFVAFGDVTPDVVARENAELSDSVHFCMGTWQ